MIISVRGKCDDSSTILSASAERRLEQAFNQDSCLCTSHVCGKKETFSPLHVRNGMSCAKEKSDLKRIEKMKRCRKSRRGKRIGGLVLKLILRDALCMFNAMLQRLWWCVQVFTWMLITNG